MRLQIPAPASDPMRARNPCSIVVLLPLRYKPSTRPSPDIIICNRTHSRTTAGSARRYLILVAKCNGTQAPFLAYLTSDSYAIETPSQAATVKENQALRKTK